MNRVGAIIASSAKELWSLIVDDGFLAIAALVAVAITWVLTREDLLGPVVVAGWLLLAMLAVSLYVSVRRAIDRYK